MRELAKRGIQPSGEALLEAVLARDSPRTEWLVDVGVFTEQHDSAGRTPMRIALENHDGELVHKLLDAKADVNATTSDHVSVLGIAMEQGDERIISRLLMAGARADGLMPDGEMILPAAIRQGRISHVQKMMKSGADPHLKDRLGNPLLHVAMEAKHHDLTQELIDLGADPAATNAVGETTLHFAFRNGWLDLAPALAAAGADPDALGVDGFTLLDRAVSSGNRDQIEALLKIGANPNHRYEAVDRMSPLERAFEAGKREIFQVFLDQGVRPADGKWDGWLWKSLETGNLAGARGLISHEAIEGGIYRNGLNLVETAALAQNGSFVKLLTDFQFPVGNALYLAAARGDVDMVNLLVGCGASVNATRYPSLDTALAVAIRRKHDGVAVFLLRHGADLNLKGPEGQTALHCAVATGCARVVGEMLAAGCDPNLPVEVPVSPAFIQTVRPGVMRWLLKNDTNITPLMIAADAGDIATAKTLLKAGARSGVWTKPSKIWPINFASRRNDVKMMRLFLGKDPLREERWIEVRLSEQRARVFDAVGNEIFSTRVSTGKKGHDTPTGEFVITNKYRDWKSTLYHASMPYFQRFSCGDFGMHEGNVPNYPASHGCIRLPAGTAKKLFSMTQAGDRVNIVP